MLKEKIITKIKEHEENKIKLDENRINELKKKYENMTEKELLIELLLQLDTTKREIDDRLQLIENSIIINNYNKR